jgi:hypothetical protein
MPIRVKCEKCKKTLSVKDHLAGKKIKCPVCQNVVAVPAAPAATTAPASKPTPPAAAKKPAASAKPAATTISAPERMKSNGTPSPANTAKSNGTPAPEPEMIELPPENIEAEAASAFADEPAVPAAEDGTPKTIDFKCSYCEVELHLPLELAGKQAPCPNPECRRIIKVPLPKVAEKKDWRKMDRRGPAAAVINQPEQLENAWGTEEATRARQDSLAQAGAIAGPANKPRGTLGWVRIGFFVGVAVAILAMLYVAGYKLIGRSQYHHAIKEIEDLVSEKDPKIKNPLLRAEGHRTLALLHLRESAGKAEKARRHFLGALSLVESENPDNKSPAVNEQLFRIDIALAQVELGGDGDDVLRKNKLEWKDVRDELANTFGKIDGPEVQVLALRKIGGRLFEKKQAGLAIGLAAALSNSESPGKNLAPFRQQIAMLYAMPDHEENANKLVKKPDPATLKELQDAHARVGYAEGLACKDDYINALAIAQIPGPPKDKLEACLGVAAIAWQRKNKDEAAKFVKAAVSLVKEVKEPSSSWPWQQLQLVKLAACTEDAEAIKDIVKSLPAPFKLRARLEIFLALCEKSSGEVSADSLQEIEAIDKEGITLALAWTALAQHNARQGASRARNRSIFEDHIGTVTLPNEMIEMIRPMVDIGSYLGSMK